MTPKSQLFWFCQTGHIKGSSGKQVPSSFFPYGLHYFTSMPKGFEAHLLIMTFPASSIPFFTCLYAVKCFEKEESRQWGELLEL